MKLWPNRQKPVPKCDVCSCDSCVMNEIGINDALRHLYMLNIRHLYMLNI